MKYSIYALVAVALACVSCAKEIQEEMTPMSQEQQTLMTKLVGGTQGEFVPGSVLVKMTEATAAELTDGNTSVFAGMEGVTITPALPIQPKNIEVARKYGLHQWFMVEFDRQMPQEKIASRLAAMPEVKAVQYNRYLEPVRSEMTAPLTQIPMTRSADGVVPKDHTFNDPYLYQQWNLINDGTITEDAVEGADVGVKDAWKLTAGDPSVVIAVFDCAVNSIHEDLKDALWVNQAEVNGEAGKDDDGNGFIDDNYGFNFVGCFWLNEDNVTDRLNGKPVTGAVQGKLLNWTAGSGHGTHVAGIIGATNNNGKGVSSIAGGTGNGDGVRLMTCQIFEGNKSTSDAQSAAAFIYAADNGACIAQCSYANQAIITEDDVYINGNDSDNLSNKINGSPLENAALKYFLDPANSNHESLEGNMAIFAAGNHSNPYSGYPGALPYVISVTAFGIDYLPGGYTNYGPGCKIAAPGGEFWDANQRNRAVLSTGVSNRKDGQYVFMQGTSMACPHVSGVVALGLSYAKKLGKKFTRDEFTSLLLTSVNDMDGLCKGTKQYAGNTIPLEQYKGKLGTGAVDAWKFLMAIEGTPTVMVKAGEKAEIDLSQWLGGTAHNLQFDMTIEEATKSALGLTADPMINNGKLELTCTKVGAGKVTFTAGIGKDSTTENGIGEMAFSREISIVSRPYAAANGGWF